MLRKISQVLGTALAIAFASQALVVGFSAARIGLLPGDDTAGGGSGDIYWSQVFGFDNATAFPVVTACMNAKNDGTATACSLATNIDSNFSLPFSGTTYIRKLVCVAIDSPVDFVNSASWYDIQVYESQGSDDVGGTAFVRTAIGSPLRIAATGDDEVDNNVAVTVEINAFSSLSDGVLSIGFSAVNDVGALETEAAASCVLHGID